MTTTVSRKNIEDLTLRIGHEMFDRMERHAPCPVNLQWWQDQMLAIMMNNERLKIQAFRFIDALPTVGKNQTEMARHMKEYFVLPEPPQNGRAHRTADDERRAALLELKRTDTPDRLDKLVSSLMDFKRLDGVWPRFLCWFAWKASTIMAGQFFAGSNIDEAEQAIRRLRKQQLAFTIDVLGEAARSTSEALEYHETYLRLITELPKKASTWAPEPMIEGAGDEAIPRVNVSIKLTSIHPGFDVLAGEAGKNVTKERLRTLLRAAMAGGVHVHVDMEHYAIKDLTLEIFYELLMEKEFRDYPHFGIVLQAYLKDGDKDAHEFVEWAKKRGTQTWVRLVKGAYWDSETVWADQAGWPWPVWEQKWMSDACFERMTNVLLKNWRHAPSAFASHNIRSLACAVAHRELYEIPGSHFELQMLYGMGDPIKRACIDMGQRSRIYTPYGQLLPGMAYFIRRLLENTANEGFLRQAGDDTPREVLLRNPELTGADAPPFKKPVVVRYELETPIMDPFENAPNTDFTQPKARQKMQAGLANARAEMGREIPLIIDGRHAVTDAWNNSLNPSRPSEIVGKVAQAGSDQVDQAVAAAARAFGEWRAVPAHERAERLFKMADLMLERRFDLAAVLVYECGKPWREADAEVSEAVDFCNYYAKEMIRLADHVRQRDIPGEINQHMYAPLGVVAVIGPWNFPLAILTGMTAAALVTGNTVVVKPASASSVTGAKLMEIIETAGLPAGVANCIYGPGEVVGEMLVKHPKVAMIAFTGSRAAGQRINQLAAETLAEQPAIKKVVAEMGGKNAIIVDSDADMDVAIKGVTDSAFSYAGQKCSAASRCIVVEPLYDRFVERLVEAMRGARPSPADEGGCFIPPVIDKQAFDAVHALIEIGKQEANCVLEVDSSNVIAENDDGYYVGPTIFSDVAPDARIAQEGVFGPVLSILRARDFDHAVEIFNGVEYALTGGVFSRSPGNLEKARQHCECGNLYINRKITGALVDIQPFGGFKMSGIGAKTGGPDYLIQFCQSRTVTENTLRRGFAPSEEMIESVS